ncbi:MAG: HAMP domain-containing sensor histidine kinase [Hymenobacter sp.]
MGQLLTLRNVSDFKKLDQVKSNFLATVSHEFKTPLSSINLSLKVLQKDNLPAAERQDITVGIQRETQRLQRLVSELLDVSRLDSGQGIQLNFAPTQLADVVRFAEATVQAQLANKQLTLQTALPPTCRPCGPTWRKRPGCLLTCWPMPSATRRPAKASRCRPSAPASSSR